MTPTTTDRPHVVPVWQHGELNTLAAMPGDIPAELLELVRRHTELFFEHRDLIAARRGAEQAAKAATEADDQARARATWQRSKRPAPAGPAARQAAVDAIDAEQNTARALRDLEAEIARQVISPAWAADLAQALDTQQAAIGDAIATIAEALRRRGRLRQLRALATGERTIERAGAVPPDSVADGVAYTVRRAITEAEAIPPWEHVPVG